MEKGKTRSWTAGGVALLGFAVFCQSTAVIFLKLSTVPPAPVSGYRLLGAALLLAPLFGKRLLQHRDAFSAREMKKCVIPGVILAAHFITWVVGLRLTYSANATLAVNMVPVALPFFLFFLARERLKRMEIAGTAVAVAGLVVMSAGDYHVSVTTLKGDLICTLSMLLLSAYYAYGRLNMASFPSVWIYVVPMYFLAGAICLVTGAFLEGGVVWPAGKEWLWILGLVLLPTILGHSLVNAALKHMRGQVVGLFTSSQFIFAGFLAHWCFAEAPQPSFYAASVLMILGVLIVLKARPER